MVWSAQDFKPIKTLSGHEAKITSLDITKGYGNYDLKWISVCFPDGQQIATVSHDRTIKIWTSRSNGKENDMDLD
ncbi:hypothetical protein BHM03_00055583 [Ensete ventricosum]|nr:hypothetical protein BHM03_00055583 [Ensete ventricosum]